MMLDRPSAKAVNVLSDIIVYKLVSYNNIMVMSLSLHSAVCHICSVPYLNNGTPLPLMLWHARLQTRSMHSH